MNPGERERCSGAHLGTDDDERSRSHLPTRLEMFWKVRCFILILHFCSIQFITKVLIKPNSAHLD